MPEIVNDEFVEMGQQHVWRAVQGLPAPLFKLLMRFPKQVWVGGGYLLSTLLREQPRDIDVFHAPLNLDTDITASFEIEELGAKKYPRSYDDMNEIDERWGRLVSTVATTYTKLPTPVQFIRSWQFVSPEQLLSTFDLSLSRAAIWFDGYETKPYVDGLTGQGHKREPVWKGICDPQYFEHIAARMCVFRYPKRWWQTDAVNAGSALLRLFKFAGRGWTVPVDTIAEVVARMTVDDYENDGAVAKASSALLGKLFEAYPNSVKQLQAKAWERLVNPPAVT